MLLLRVLAHNNVLSAG